MSELEHPTVPGFVFDAFDEGWTSRDVMAPCVICQLPAFCRDPEGRPRHRIDCAGLPDAIAVAS